MVALEPPGLSPDRRRGQPYHVGQTGGPRALEEGGRVVPVHGPDTALANGLVVAVADAEMIGHGQPEDGKDQFACAFGAPLGTHGPSAAADRAVQGHALTIS